MQEASQSYCIKSTCLQTTTLRRVPVYLPINPYPVLYSLQAWKLHHLLPSVTAPLLQYRQSEKKKAGWSMLEFHCCPQQSGTRCRIDLEGYYLISMVDTTLFSHFYNTTVTSRPLRLLPWSFPMVGDAISQW